MELADLIPTSVRIVLGLVLGVFTGLYTARRKTTNRGRP